MDGLYYLKLTIPNESFFNIYGDNPNFQNGYLGFTSGVVGSINLNIGLQVEDNEWRESWKRFGETEDIRFGVALGKIYHDVQPEALVQIEGSVLGTIFPREICRFLWMDLKTFIPARIEIDFTNGRTNTFLIESKHEIITDYVD
jgi:hypothetical protein